MPLDNADITPLTDVQPNTNNNNNRRPIIILKNKKKN